MVTWTLDHTSATCSASWWMPRSTARRTLAPSPSDSPRDWMPRRGWCSSTSCRPRSARSPATSRPARSTYGCADARPAAPVDLDDTSTSRTTLRLPDALKARVDEAAAADGLSVNTWLVRAIAAALQPKQRRSAQRTLRTGDNFAGWACLVPGLMEALNPREDESHGGTEEVPRGASGAGDPDGGRRAAGPGHPAGRGAAGRGAAG